MACQFEVVLPGENAGSIPAARTALNLADSLESRLSVFRQTSELSSINRSAGAGPVGVSPALFRLLQRSAELHSSTEGAFDITSTPLSRCWGFVRRDPAVPARESLDAARRCVGMALVRLDALQRTVSFNGPGVELNLGSIGKGYALDRMGARLHRLGVPAALISAGGSSILALGADGDGWPVHVSSKLCAGRIARLRLRGVAMATSGAGEQFVTADGRRYGHVLDPRTGWPASGVLSATVVTRDAADADALATAFLVGGPALAHRYCARHANVLALLALDDQERSRVRVGACPGAIVEEV
jgi:thiamine biosynthesis lipoprotein